MWEGWHREVSPYPDLLPHSSHLTAAIRTARTGGGQRTVRGYPSGGRIRAFAPHSGQSLGSELRRSARAPPSSADARQAAVATVIGDGSGALSKRGGIKIGCLRLLALNDLPQPPWQQPDQWRHSLVG